MNQPRSIEQNRALMGHLQALLVILQGKRKSYAELSELLVQLVNDSIVTNPASLEASTCKVNDQLQQITGISENMNQLCHLATRSIPGLVPASRTSLRELITQLKAYLNRTPFVADGLSDLIRNLQGEHKSLREQAIHVHRQAAKAGIIASSIHGHLKAVRNTIVFPNRNQGKYAARHEQHRSAESILINIVS